MSETDCQDTPFATPPPPPTAGNGQAIASMVLGILSYVLCCGPLCSVPAVVLGHLSLGKIRRGVMSQDARGFALAGTLLGWINIALVALVFGFMLLSMGFALFTGGATHVSPFIYKL